MIQEVKDVRVALEDDRIVLNAAIIGDASTAQAGPAPREAASRESQPVTASSPSARHAHHDQKQLAPCPTWLFNMALGYDLLHEVVSSSDPFHLLNC